METQSAASAGIAAQPAAAGDRRGLDLPTAAGLSAADVLRRLDSSAEGLATTQARARLARVGPNVLRTHGVRAITVFLIMIASLRYLDTFAKIDGS